MTGPLGGRLAPACLGLAVLIVVLLQPLRPSLPESIGRVTLNEPVAIADLLEETVPAGTHASILNEQVWGGYLSYRLGDRVKTAMDGRIEIRSRAIWIWYFGLMHGDGDPAADLASHGVAWAVLSPERSRLVAKLLKAGWVIELQAADSLLLRTPTA